MFGSQLKNNDRRCLEEKTVASELKNPVSFRGVLISPCPPPPPGREMVGKSLIAGLVVLLVAAVSLFLGVFMGLGKKNTPPTSDHFYSKAAVAADAGKCSEVGR